MKTFLALYALACAVALGRLVQLAARQLQRELARARRNAETRKALEAITARRKGFSTSAPRNPSLV
jgi:hypothetical protein